jgi:hypothetical protein
MQPAVELFPFGPDEMHPIYNPIVIIHQKGRDAPIRVVRMMPRLSLDLVLMELEMGCIEWTME